MACGKTLTGQEDTMNALCKYYAAVSGLLDIRKAITKYVKSAPM